MKPIILLRPLGFAASLILALSSSPLHSGDNLEVVTGGGTVISHRLWSPTAFPLTWMLHQNGIPNNNSVGAGTPALTNAQISAELAAAFQSWQNLPLSTLVVGAGGTTPFGDIGCDLINVITWSDTVNPLGPGSSTIARGVTTAYVGADVVLGNAADLNRNVPCGTGGAIVNLPIASYPMGMTLAAGTIFDMDMTWNDPDFDYVTAPNVTFGVLDIRAVAAHEFGHMFGFSHTSMAFLASNPATMFPIVSSTNVLLQNNMRTLELDEDASAGRGYPDAGFHPAGAGPYTTGTITGQITTPAGAAATGVRVWAFTAASTAQPVYETFSITSADWDPTLAAGDYVLDGLQPGDYFVCILPWNNGVPSATAASPNRYNTTTINGVNNTGFGTECYDDAQSAASPDFASPDLVRRATVAAGQTTPHIDFVTGVGTSDFMLIMDRSGSMNLPSGSPGVTKIQALQNSANAFVDFLNVTGAHRIGLAQFNSALVPLTPVVNLQTLNAASLANAHSAVNTMAAGGMTNIIAGIQEGINQLTAIAAPSPRQVMLVFTDGLHNTPPGSDLNTMHDPVVNNDIRFYSIGYGTSVDDAILSNIAHDSGGLHVNEQALSPIALSKHFLSIAASAADLTTLIDPLYALSPGGAANLAFAVSPDERDLTFVVHWNERNRDFANVVIRTPGKCAISGSVAGAGYELRRGDTYAIIHVPVPFTCRNHPVTAGVWRLSAKASPDKGGELEMIVYGHSPVNVVVETAMTRFGPMAFAKVLRYGEVVPAGSVVGELLVPLKATRDSTDQDAFGTNYCSPKAGARDTASVPETVKLDPRCSAVPVSVPREKRTLRVAFFDDGTHGDARGGDGVYSARLPLNEVGPYHLRIVSMREGKGAPAQEQTADFYFDGKRIQNQAARK